MRPFALIAQAPKRLDLSSKGERLQIRIGPAWQLLVIPIAAPLVDVAVHVMQSPAVGGITADFGGPTKRWSRLGPVVRLPLEIRLSATELIAECSGCRRSGPTGVFPLRFGWQSELPILREFTGLMAELGELLAEPLRFGKVDIADGVVISIGQLQRQLARQLSNDPSPLPLRRLEFGHPKALGQGHFDLNFARAPFGFAGCATHSEFAWRAPAKFDAGDLAFVSGFGTEEEFGAGGGCDGNSGRYVCAGLAMSSN